MLETDASASASASNVDNTCTIENDSDVKPSVEYSDNPSGDGSSISRDYSNWNAGSESYANYDGYNAGYDNNGNGEGVGQTGDYANDSGGYGDYGQYENHWIDKSSVNQVGEVSGLAESGLYMSGKRGRNDALSQIVEVKQDELLKNRPREDRVKLTGIAFGPAYKWATKRRKQYTQEEIE